MTDTQPTPSIGFEGKYLVWLLLVLGVVAGVGTYLWHSRQTYRSVEFWGPQAVAAIRHAQTVEACRLELAEPKDLGDQLAKTQLADAQLADAQLAGKKPATTSSEHPESTDDFPETILVGGQRWRITDRRPIVSGIGTELTFVRRAMLYDYSFAWSGPSDNQDSSNPGPQRQWQYALRFLHNGQTTTVLIDLEPDQPLESLKSPQIYYLEANKSLRLSQSGTHLLRDHLTIGLARPSSTD